MGTGQSKNIVSGGVLHSAIPEPIAQAPANAIPSVTKKLKASVPRSVSGRTTGKQFLDVNIQGQQKSIIIPAGLRAGDEFTFEVVLNSYDKVFSSTLHQIPGMDILQSKPVVFGSVSKSYRYYGYTSSGQQTMGDEIKALLKAAQEKVVELTVEQRCNACLGMAFNVTNDSAGDNGRDKVVIVTAYGTPCVVVPKVSGPTVMATVPYVSASAPPLAQARVYTSDVVRELDG